MAKCLCANVNAMLCKQVKEINKNQELRQEKQTGLSAVYVIAATS